MLLCNCLSCFLFIWAFESTSCQGMFHDLLRSTQQLVNYYKEQFGNMNLDGIYGLRVLEGQALLILQRSPNLDKSVHSFLTNIYQDAHNISEQSLAFLKQSEPEYFEHLHRLVDKPLLVAESYRRIDPKLKWPPKPPGRQKEISEIKSDECVGYILGSRSDSQCKMPKDCLDIFTEPGYADYSLTHQILYSLVVQQHECSSEYEAYLQNKGYTGGMAQLRLEFCTNIFYDAASLVQKVKKLLPITQDLFMEQVFTCAVMGFMEFVHVDWLRQLISWQKPSGCFGAMSRTANVKHRPEGINYAYAANDKDDDESAKKIYFQKNGNGHIDQVDGDQNVRVINHHDVQADGNHDALRQQHVDDVVSNVGQKPVVDWWKGNQDKLQDNNILKNWNQPDVQQLKMVRNNDMEWPQQQPQPTQQPPQQQQNQQQQQQQQQQLYQKPQLLGQMLNKLPSKDVGLQNINQLKMIRNNDMEWPQQQPPPPQQQQPPPAQQQPQYEVQLGKIPPVPPAKLAANKQQALGQQAQMQQAVVQQNVGNKNLLSIHTESSNYTGNMIAASDMKQGDGHLGVRRRLLVEKSLEGSCLAHKTAVAAGMLSQYLRFFIDPGPPEYRAIVQIDGLNHMMLAIPGDDEYEDKEDELDDRGQGMRHNPAEDLAKDKARLGRHDVDENSHHGANYLGDNEDKPQAYYNDDDDDDGNLANRDLRVPKDDHHRDENVRYQKHVGKVNAIETDNKLYMEENKKNPLFNQMGEGEKINPKHQPIIDQHQKDEGGAANNYVYYYDDKDDKKKDGQLNRPLQMTNGAKSDIINAQRYENDRKVDTGVSVGTSYAALLLVMALLLYYMTKFVRRRRIMIRYR